MRTDYLRMPKNFMTPDVVMYEQCGDRIIELSSGVGLFGEPIWGVSEFIEDRTARFGLQSTENGKMFENLKEAKKYYSLLKMRYI